MNKCTTSTVLVAMAILGSPGEAAFNSTLEEAVLAIERRLPMLKKTSPRLHVGSDGGAVLDAWMENRSPQKIALSVILSSRELQLVFYFQESVPLLAIKSERWFLWDEDVGELDPRRTARLIQTTYIFGDQNARISEAREGIVVKAVPDEERRRVHQIGLFIQNALKEGNSTIDLEDLLKQG